jgi:hypothetical protein
LAIVARAARGGGPSATQTSVGGPDHGGAARSAGDFAPRRNARDRDEGGGGAVAHVLHNPGAGGSRPMSSSSSIDTAFDPTRPQPSSTNGETRSASTSLKEEPVPHLDPTAANLAEPAEEGARIADDGAPFPDDNDELFVDDLYAAERPHGDISSNEGAEAPSFIDIIDIDLEDIVGSAAEVDGKVRALVKKHPFKALAVAVVGGFVLGRVASRI